MAARAQLAYAEKKANIMEEKADILLSVLKQRANYEASFHLVQSQKAAAAAKALATAYEEVGS